MSGATISAGVNIGNGVAGTATADAGPGPTPAAASLANAIAPRPTQQALEDNAVQILSDKGLNPEQKQRALEALTRKAERNGGLNWTRIVYKLDPVQTIDALIETKAVDSARTFGYSRNDPLQGALKNKAGADFVRVMCDPTVTPAQKLGVNDQLVAAGFSRQELRTLFGRGEETIRKEVIPQLDLGQALQLHRDMKIIDKQLGNDVGMIENNKMQGAIAQQIGKKLAEQLASDMPTDQKLKLLESVNKTAGGEPLKIAMSELTKRVGDARMLTGTQAEDLLSVIKQTDRLCRGCSENNDLEKRVRRALDSGTLP